MDGLGAHTHTHIQGQKDERMAKVIGGKHAPLALSLPRSKGEGGGEMMRDVWCGGLRWRERTGGT